MRNAGARSLQSWAEKVVERKKAVGGQRRRGDVNMTSRTARRVYTDVHIEKSGIGAERRSYLTVSMRAYHI